MDLIGRQAAIDALGEEPLVWNEDDAGEVTERNQWKQDVAAIKALPSAERRGRWIAVENDIDYYPFMCSECYETVIKRTNYCSKCGAKMEVKENEND